MRQLQCKNPVCRKIGPEQNASPGANMKAGFAPFFDISNGLEAHYLCADCALQLQRAARQIVALTGGVENLYFRGLLTMADKLAPFILAQ